MVSPELIPPELIPPELIPPDQAPSGSKDGPSPLGLQDVWDLAPGHPLLVDDLVECGDPGFSSAFAVNEVTKTSVSLAALAMNEFARQRGLDPGPLRISGPRAAAGFTNHLEVNGVAPPLWADLSGYYETGDGRHIQFHCNFPHHAAGIVELLGGVAERTAIAAEVHKWDSDALETELIRRGMIAAKLRTMDEWRSHPHAQATESLPLIEFEQIGDADPRQDLLLSQADDPDTGLQGIRVLDCSRVLAGPVAGQTLGSHGADVLRIGSPTLPSVEICVQLTGAGKRNANVDLNQAAGRETLGSLLNETDVWIDAFRPGALANKGFVDEQVADRNPGIVIVQLCAFDWVGPWAGRRGFDSIVQSTTGIVHAGSVAGSVASPLSLPVQALDYATGQLAAFVAARALAHQRRHGGSWRVRLSLLRTRNWLVSHGGPSEFVPAAAVADPSALYEIGTDWGLLRLAQPATGNWRSAPRPLGTAQPEWLPR